jgi:hypothetical protein
MRHPAQPARARRDTLARARPSQSLRALNQDVDEKVWAADDLVVLGDD